MGKIQCSSTKSELSKQNRFSIENKTLNRSKFDEKVNKEYTELLEKFKSDKSTANSNICEPFLLIDTKKKLTRFLKWIKMSYKSDFPSSKLKDFSKMTDDKINLLNQLESIYESIRYEVDQISDFEDFDKAEVSLNDFIIEAEQFDFETENQPKFSYQNSWYNINQNDKMLVDTINSSEIVHSKSCGILSTYRDFDILAGDIVSNFVSKTSATENLEGKLFISNVLEVVKEKQTLKNFREHYDLLLNTTNKSQKGQNNKKIKQQSEVIRSIKDPDKSFRTYLNKKIEVDQKRIINNFRKHNSTKNLDRDQDELKLKLERISDNQDINFSNTLKNRNKIFFESSDKKEGKFRLSLNENFISDKKEDEQTLGKKFNSDQKNNRPVRDKDRDINIDKDLLKFFKGNNLMINEKSPNNPIIKNQNKFDFSNFNKKFDRSLKLNELEFKNSPLIGDNLIERRNKERKSQIKFLDLENNLVDNNTNPAMRDLSMQMTINTLGETKPNKKKHSFKGKGIFNMQPINSPGNKCFIFSES